MHLNSRLLFEKYARQYFKPEMRVLEIGPSGIPSAYQSLVSDETITWDTLDIGEDNRLTYSGVQEYGFPIEENSYDLVLSGQVLEHVKRIWVWIKELSRICKIGGYVITINPVSWPYHEYPVDCWRVFPDGMRALYEEGDLTVLLSRCESLESTRFRRTIPGVGLDFQSRPLVTISTFLGLFGFPVVCAYDTITIGQKVDGRQNLNENS